MLLNCYSNKFLNLILYIIMFLWCLMPFIHFHSRYLAYTIFFCIVVGIVLKIFTRLWKCYSFWYDIKKVKYLFPHHLEKWKFGIISEIEAHIVCEKCHSCYIRLNAVSIHSISYNIFSFPYKHRIGSHRIGDSFAALFIRVTAVWALSGELTIMFFHSALFAHLFYGSDGRDDDHHHYIDPFADMTTKSLLDR